MSLISSLHTTFSGIRTTEAQIQTVSSNITNADKAGYTKKTYQSSYTTANGITTPAGGITIGSLDEQLYKEVINDVTEAGYSAIIAEYLETYSSNLGSTDGSNSLSADIDNLQTQLSALETSPENSSQKINVIDSANVIANTLNNLSQDIQAQRLQADQEISESVETINNALEVINNLNQKIIVLEAQGASTADLEDERMVALEELAQQIDISYFVTDNNQVKVYTSSGQPLLNSQVHSLSYESSTSVSSTSTYPADFDAITVNGVDITVNLQGGTLGALVELRDEILVGEQDKLDEFAATLSDIMNAQLNEGASYPARTSITGDVSALVLGDTFSATGTLRLAVTDQTGTVQSVNDIDLSAYTTIGGLVSALDALTGVSASLSTEGELVINADNSGAGISFNQMDSDVGADTGSFGSYFGLNNMFTGDGAQYLQVSDYLIDTPEYLATGTLSNSAVLSSGDIGIAGGDATIAEALLDAFTTTADFDAAGNFVSQSITFSSYSNKIMSTAANVADTAALEADTAALVYEETKNLMLNKTGVNIDEETIRLAELENHYEASALLIATLQDMFNTLINAVR